MCILHKDARNLARTPHSSFLYMYPGRATNLARFFSQRINDIERLQPFVSSISVFPLPASSKPVSRFASSHSLYSIRVSSAEALPFASFFSDTLVLCNFCIVQIHQPKPFISVFIACEDPARSKVHHHRHKYGLFSTDFQVHQGIIQKQQGKGA